MKYFLHLKTGRVYGLLHVAVNEADGVTELAVYQHLTADTWTKKPRLTGTVWVRSSAELHDTKRFQPISTHDAQAIALDPFARPAEYAPEGDEMRCPTCWTSDRVTLGDCFLSGIEASCARCDQNWLWFGKGGDQ